MTNELHLETGTAAAGRRREWGLHNGLVVLAALGLVTLSLLLDWVMDAGLLTGPSLWMGWLLSQMRFILMLAAGTLIGMLVATRMLQAHVGPRGARLLALWGIVAMVLSALLQAGLILLNLQLQDAGLPLLFAFLNVSELVTGSMAIGASMIALAFVGRLRH